MLKRGIILGLGVFFVSCQGAEQVNSRSQARQGFHVEISQPNGGLALAGVNLEITAIEGSFTGCQDPDWKVEGASGDVYSSMSCNGITYKSVSFREANSSTITTLTANGGDIYKDTMGGEWRFRTTLGFAGAVLQSSFNAEFEEGVTVQSNKYRIQVSVDNEDEAICDLQKPFSISSDDNSLLSVKLNYPDNTTVRGVEFKVYENRLGQGHPKPEAVNAGFHIDLSGAKPDMYVYENVMSAEKDGSSCVVKKLTVNLEARDLCQQLYSQAAQPYHVLTDDGRCVWSCSAGTSPNNQTGECSCRAGLTETGKDRSGRKICE